jgi:putative phage-type endonuclease
MSGLTKKQLEIRKTGIGGSEVAAILGICQYRTIHDIWLQKTGRKEPDDLSGNNKVELGHMLETPLAKKYAKENKCKITRLKQTLRHPLYSWLVASPDGVFIYEDKILEIKTATYPGKLWGASGTDIVPMNYILQVQHYMNVIGAVKECIIKETDIYACIFASKKNEVFRTYTIKRDDLIINYITEKLGIFWNDYVLKDMPPPESL